MRRLTGRALLLGHLLALVATGVAQAGEATRDPQSGRVMFQADAGEANALEVAWIADADAAQPGAQPALVFDDATTVTPGAGCAADGDKARCPAGPGLIGND